MSKKSAAEVAVFTSKFSGDTFPVSDLVEIEGYGPVTQAEVESNESVFVIADDLGEMRHIDDTVAGLDADYVKVRVSRDTTWEVDPDGVRIHPDAERAVYISNGRGGRTLAVCHEDDARLYQDDYDSEWYWADHFERSTSAPDYDVVSEYNIRENFSRCEGCDELFPNDDLNEDGYCSDCAASRDDDTEDDDSGDGSLAGYRDRGYPPKRGAGPVFFGVELEVEMNSRSGGDRTEKSRRVARLCHDEQGRFILTKEDGSLSYGFEIVSAPMTLDRHMTAWSKFFAALEDRSLSGIKAWGTETCGMHVHVSRDPLSVYQVGKIVVFVNNPKNKAFMVDIAGRDSNTYTKFISATKITTGGRGYGGDRYCAVNLCNTNTIEFRLFKATLNRSRFLANIQFCHAMVSYCAPCARSAVEAASHTAFISWVRQHRKIYPDLDALLVRKGHLPPPKIGKATLALATSDASA